MISKLFAIICGDGMDQVGMRAQQRYYCLRNRIRQALIHWLHQGEARFSVYQTHQRAAMSFSNQCVHFPISQTHSLLNYIRSFFNADPILQFPAVIMLSVAFSGSADRRHEKELSGTWSLFVWRFSASCAGRCQAQSIVSGSFLGPQRFYGCCDRRLHKWPRVVRNE